MSPGPAAGPRPDLLARVGRGVVVGLALAGLALLASVSCHRAFQVDEIEHLHGAYHLRAGRALYAEVWQVHMPLHYGLLAPLIELDDPRASYHRARALHLVVVLATALCAASCAARLARDACDPALGQQAGEMAGALAAGLLLLHTTFVERGMEVRADGPLALCVLATLRLQVGGPGLATARAVAAGGLLGLGILLTQKAVFATAAFGAWWSWRAARERRLSRVALPLLGWSLPVAAACFVIGLQGGLAAFWNDAVLGAASAAGRGEERLAFSPLGFLLQEGRRNLAFSTLAVLGLVAALVVALRAARDPGHRARGLVWPVLVATWLLATLWLQPFPWPYVHVTVVPVVAVVAAATLVPFLARARAGLARSGWPVAALVLGLQFLTAGPRLFTKALPENGPTGQEHQLALLEEVQRVTEPDDPVFDLAGLYFRPDGYPAYALSGDLFRLYRSGGLPPMVPSLRERGTVAFVYNYRVGWLRGEEREFLHERFAHYAGNLFLLGRELGTLPAEVDVPFEVLRTKRFRYDGPPLALLVDGQPFERGELARGIHVLRLTRPAVDARLILDTPQPRPPRIAPARLYVHFD
ncbi:MAG TPA: hypothetical protein VNB06_08025 [Thermoanaerobaculia bacterium]|nr:hypothetical protein [Thermoanaerobaculia bacterium]